MQTEQVIRTDPTTHWPVEVDEEWERVCAAMGREVEWGWAFRLIYLITVAIRFANDEEIPKDELYHKYWMKCEPGKCGCRFHTIQWPLVNTFVRAQDILSGGEVECESCGEGVRKSELQLCQFCDPDVAGLVLDEVKMKTPNLCERCFTRHQRIHERE